MHKNAKVNRQEHFHSNSNRQEIKCPHFTPLLFLRGCIGNELRRHKIVLDLNLSFFSQVKKSLFVWVIYEIMMYSLTTYDNNVIFSFSRILNYIPINQNRSAYKSIQFTSIPKGSIQFTSHLLRTLSIRFLVILQHILLPLSRLIFQFPFILSNCFLSFVLFCAGISFSIRDILLSKLRCPANENGESSPQLMSQCGEF